MGDIVFPTITDTIFGENEVTLHLFAPSALRYFEGHFDSNAILPGVVQTHWAVHYGRELLGVTGEFSHLEAVKFQHVIPAEHHVTLHLRHEAAGNKLYYRYHSESGQHSSGRIIFHS